MATDPVSKRAKIKEVPERPLPNLPDDVTVEILVRLPVKSLLRFRCVCKTWNSITSDPKFSKLHRMQPCVLFCEESKKIAIITVESLLSIRAPTPAPSTPIFLPWEPDSSGASQFLGSCNGLICVDYKSDHIPGRSGLILWNPSTRKFRRLPRPRRFGNRCTYAGFGYDESVDDYKLVWANSTAVPSFEERTIELDVLSLKSNTWRSHPPLNVNLTTEELRRYHTICGVFSKGAIHWAVKRYKSFLVHYYETRILSLDLATERFRFSVAPNDRLLTYHPDMGSLEGCLCLSAASNDGFRMELWMMKKYSVESANSWTKLVRILSPIDPGYRTMGIYPLLFSNRDEIVAMLHSTNGCKIVKYYTKSRDVKPETRLSVSDHRDKTYCNAAFLHMESLVWLEEKEQQKE